MKFFYLTILMIWGTNIQAQEIYPKGCSPVVIRSPIAKLSTKKPTVIMVHNLSDSDVWVIHPSSNPESPTGTSTRLQSGKWSTLVLRHAQKKFLLRCIESKPGHEQQISCAEGLAICQWHHAQLPKKGSHALWAAENMDLAPLKAYIERLGFLLNPTHSTS